MLECHRGVRIDVVTSASVVVVVGVVGVAATALSTLRFGRVDVGETLRA